MNFLKSLVGFGSNEPVTPAEAPQRLSFERETQTTFFKFCEESDDQELKFEGLTDYHLGCIEDFCKSWRLLREEGPEPGCVTCRKIQVPTIVPPTFAIDEFDQAKKHLEEEGYVVFRDVITPEMRQAYLDQVREWVVQNAPQRTNFSWDKPETWKHWPASSLGIFSHCGVAHLPAAWALREAAHPYFAKIYGTDSLLSSFDACSIMRPTKGPTGSREYKTRENWLHVDGDGHKSVELSGYQAFVTVSGVDGATFGSPGCFQAVPKSHLEIDAFKERHPGIFKEGRNFTSVPWGDPLLMRMTRIIAPDRCLVLWKNELFHCNAPNESELFRHVVYVNMAPASLVSLDVMDLRLEAFKRGQSTTHWVHECHESSMPVSDYTPPKLSELGKKLLGSEPW